MKPASEMARLFRGYEDALSRTLEIVARCRFGLDELRYEYPEEPVPPGLTPQQWLTELAWNGAREKFGAVPPPQSSPDIGGGSPPRQRRAGGGMLEENRVVPDHIRTLIEHELAL